MDTADRTLDPGLKPQAEEYLRCVVSASTQVPTDTAVTLIYNMIAIKDLATMYSLGALAKPASYG